MCFALLVDEMRCVESFRECGPSTTTKARYRSLAYSSSSTIAPKELLVLLTLLALDFLLRTSSAPSLVGVRAASNSKLERDELLDEGDMDEGERMEEESEDEEVE